MLNYCINCKAKIYIKCSVCVCVCTHACVCVCMLTCWCTCVCVCMRTCWCMCVCVYNMGNVCIQLHTHNTHIHAHTQHTSIVYCLNIITLYMMGEYLHVYNVHYLSISASVYVYYTSTNSCTMYVCLVCIYVYLQYVALRMCRVVHLHLLFKLLLKLLLHSYAHTYVCVGARTATHAHTMYTLPYNYIYTCYIVYLCSLEVHMYILFPGTNCGYQISHES